MAPSALASPLATPMASDLATHPANRSATPPAAGRPAPPRRYLRHGTLPQIAALEAVVRLGSATLAAESLCMAQPTLSGHLRKLSEALGVQLFETRGRRLWPTAAAHAVLAAAHQVFDAFHRCEQELAVLRTSTSTSTSPSPSTSTGTRTSSNASTRSNPPDGGRGAPDTGHRAGHEAGAGRGTGGPAAAPVPRHPGDTAGRRPLPTIAAPATLPPPPCRPAPASMASAS